MSFPTVQPLIPSALWLWLWLALAAAVLWVWYARRRPPAVAPRRWRIALGMMALGLAMILYVLLNPTWVERVPPPAGKPVLTVLVDATASMATTDVSAGVGAPGQRTRYAAAIEAAQRAADALSHQFDVRIKSFADTVTTADARSLTGKEPQGSSSDLAAALVAGLESDLPQGQAVLLLSDGIHNVGGTPRVLQAVRSARAMGAPVYTQVIGGDKSRLDLAVEIQSPQDLAFIKQKVVLSVRVRQVGSTVSHKTELRLMHDGKVISRHEVDVGANQSADSHFIVSHDKAGTYAYEITASPLNGEASQANNSAAYLLRVVSEPIRVLVLEGKPYWDAKFLLRTLATDPAVALDSVVKMAEGRFVRRTLASAKPVSSAPDAPVVPPSTPPPTPVIFGETGPRTEAWQVLSDVSDVLSADRLRGYQIVVLGRDAEAYLTEDALTNLTQWIAGEGGSLVCYRGSPTAQVNQKLARLLPVKWTPTRESRVRMKLTERGQEMQWGGDAATTTLVGLPSLASAAQVDASKALAVVLATAVGVDGVETPAVVYQAYGTGRVVAIEGAGMWRWAFLPPAAQGQSADQLYGQLWQSLLRWLVSGVGLLPGQNVLLRTDKVTFSTTESATLTLLMREEGGKPAQVELHGEAGEPRLVSPAPVGEEPGSYRVNFGRLPEGKYAARIAGSTAENTSAQTVFTVRTLSEEMLDLTARPDLMRRIADDTGGAAIIDGNVKQIGARFEQFMEKARPAAIRRTTAWDRAWVLIGVVLLWSATWAVRRRGGLV